MVERAVIGPRAGAVGLWVSKPGHNVLTASDSNLLFNSNYAAFGYVMQGTHTVNWPGGDSGSFTTPIMFGRNFGTPPIVLFEHLVGGVWRSFDRGMHFSYSKGVSIYASNGFYLNRARYSVSTDILPDRINVDASYNRATRSWVVFPPLTFRYTVFTYNY